MNISPKFDQGQADILQRFLGAPVRSVDTMSYCEATGFLFVVAAAPELQQPSDWLPVILNMDDFSDGGKQEAQQVIGALMALYNELTRQVREADVSLLPGCYFHEDPLANFSANAPVRQWCVGFIQGRHWLEDSWNAYVPESLREEFNAQFMVLSYFASKVMAEEFLLESHKPDATLEKTSAGMQKLFPESMSAFAHLGSTIQKVLLQQASQPVRSEKVGRNEPCSCGSGKKYKKCCALKLH